jgi:hypothetical protein
MLPFIRRFCTIHGARIGQINANFDISVGECVGWKQTTEMLFGKNQCFQGKPTVETRKTKKSC